MTMPTSPAGWPEPPEEPRQSTSWPGIVVASFLFIPISFVRPGLKVLGAPQELATPLLLMFALPASLIWILLGLAMPAIADRGIGGVTAIGESVRLTAGHRGDMLLVGFLLFVLSGVGMCLCCLGTPIVSALLPLSLSFIYLKQTGQRVEEAG